MLVRRCDFKTIVPDGQNIAAVIILYAWAAVYNVVATPVLLGAF